MNTSRTTTADVLAGVRLDGKRAVVTGATGGIGLETARALAAAGAVVTLTGRRADALRAATAVIVDQHPGAQLSTIHLELGSLGSISAAAKQLVDAGPIDILINNAGVMMPPLSLTEDGFELQTGTNHLGHFALTMGLAPAFTSGARVVALSSSAHDRSTVYFDDFNWEKRDYDPSVAYGQSKTANIWFASELQRRADGRILALSVHPGAIMTDLGRHLPAEMLEAMKGQIGKHLKTVPEGAATSVWAATAPELSSHGGRYLADCQLVPIEPDPTADESCAPWAYDTDGAQRLWELSADLTGTAWP